MRLTCFFTQTICLISVNIWGHIYTHPNFKYDHSWDIKDWSNYSHSAYNWHIDNNEIKTDDNSSLTDLMAPFSWLNSQKIFCFQSSNADRWGSAGNPSNICPIRAKTEMHRNVAVKYVFQRCEAVNADAWKHKLQVLASCITETAQHNSGDTVIKTVCMTVSQNKGVDRKGSPTSAKTDLHWFRMCSATPASSTHLNLRMSKSNIIKSTHRTQQKYKWAGG